MTTSQPALVRFSLRTLLVLMMLLCIALATTVSASPLVELAMKWVSALAPAAAILLAAWTSGVKRAFWIGFAAFGIWAYVHFGVYRSQIRPALAGGFSTVFDLLEDQLCTLHSNTVRADADKRFRKETAHLLSENPTWTLEDIKARYPNPYSNFIDHERGVVTGTASSIAWNNLFLAIAVLGGLAVSAIFAWRNPSASP